MHIWHIACRHRVISDAEGSERLVEAPTTEIFSIFHDLLLAGKGLEVRAIATSSLTSNEWSHDSSHKYLYRYR